MERAIKNMEKHSLITNTKIELLRNGVNFNPLNMFSNYEDINKYKTKKIKVKPTIVGSEVYDLEKNSNILPSEVILSHDDRKSICKLRYNSSSPMRIVLKDKMLSLYNSDYLIPISIEFVEKINILNKKTGININGIDTVVGDFIDIVGVDRISILFFEGCYNWNCGKACKFCDLHPKQKCDAVVKPTTNQLFYYNNNIKAWWEATREKYFAGIKFSLEEVLKYFGNTHCHIFFMSGNLPSLEDVWNVSEDLICFVSKFINLSKFDTYLNIAPHDNIERLKRIKDYGIRQVQYNLEIANQILFEDACPGKLKYEVFAKKLVEAVSVMGKGNVRSNFVFGLQDKEELLSEIKKLASCGIVADYSIFQPKNNTPFQEKKAPNFDDVLEFSEKLTDIYYEYKFKPIFCSLSSRSSIINEIYEDRYKNNIL